MKSQDKELLITHLFDAPVKLVFDAWTDPEKLRRWYAPDGCTIEYKSIDVKKGGAFIPAFMIRCMAIAGLLVLIWKYCNQGSWFSQCSFLMKEVI
nr:SRPBCC domain-containing protein [Niabella ginsenosidivorans]